MRDAITTVGITDTNFPIIPVITNIGAKDNTVVRTEANTGRTTSIVPSKIDSILL